MQALQFKHYSARNDRLVIEIDCLQPVCWIEHCSRNNIGLEMQKTLHLTLEAYPLAARLKAKSMNSTPKVHALELILVSNDKSLTTQTKLKCDACQSQGRRRKKKRNKQKHKEKKRRKEGRQKRHLSVRREGEKTQKRAH